MNNSTQQLFSHCPRCGREPFESVSNKSRRCPACQFVFFFNPAAATAALIVDNADRLLVVVRAHDPGAGMLDLPGGFVDAGENAEEAIRREVKEELNLEVEQTDYFLSVPNRYLFKDVTYHTLDLAFICRVQSLEDLKPQDDVKEVLFLPAGEIELEQFAFESIRTMVKTFLETR